MGRAVKRVLITGGSGFIGRRLVAELLARGDLVTVLTRDVGSAKRRLPGAVRVAAWTPEREGPWFNEVGVVDAVVHLAGELVVRRWTEAGKRAIEQSRVESTRLLVEAIGRAKHKPAVLVTASATGYYGPRPGSEQVDEDSTSASDFLAGLVQRWEAAARAVGDHGVRDVQLRFGIVLGEGGSLAQMTLPFKLFAGGPVGDGKQVVSWIHRDDAVGLLLLALDDSTISGAMNAVSPYPATGQELADAIGVVLGRPSWIRTPAWALRLAFGEAASVLTTGQRVFPKRAVELGYEFRHARLVPALESILGDG
jgi:uncharacterized protein (TIGR01777 family)